MSDYLKKRMEQILAGRPLPERKNYNIPKKSAKRIQKEKDEAAAAKESFSEKKLELWFFHINNKHNIGNGCRCMECGEWIPREYIRHATAHLLPKKIFKSVATHELNYMIYGASCGCHEKTHRVDKFIQMKTWPEAARRIKIMIPLLPMDELRHISNQLLEALDNTD